MPSVTLLDDGSLIVVYVDNSSDDKSNYELKYNVGQIEDGSISWNIEFETYAKGGELPAIDAYGDILIHSYKDTENKELYSGVARLIREL
jgi:hypothetical protein